MGLLPVVYVLVNQVPTKDSWILAAPYWFRDANAASRYSYLMTKVYPDWPKTRPYKFPVIWGSMGYFNPATFMGNVVIVATSLFGDWKAAPTNGATLTVINDREKLLWDKILIPA